MTWHWSFVNAVLLQSLNNDPCRAARDLALPETNAHVDLQPSSKGSLFAVRRLER